MRWLVCLALSLSLLLASCALHPPHYAGENRPTAGPQGERPTWTGWGVKLQDDSVYIVGHAAHRASREIALRIAEENARERLTATTKTRIISDRELRETFHTLEAEGSLAAEGSLEAEGKSKNVELRPNAEVRLRGIVRRLLEGTENADEYWEEIEVFENGWKQLFNCWVLIKISEEKYVRRLAEAIAEG